MLNPSHPATVSHLRRKLERVLDCILAAAAIEEMPGRTKLRLLRCANDLTQIITRLPAGRRPSKGVPR